MRRCPQAAKEKKEFRKIKLKIKKIKSRKIKNLEWTKELGNVE
jgi:hypothetical protein